MKVINHAAKENNWLNDKVKQLLYNSKKLVLGSFNPHNPNSNTDFYYGRYSNFFWKIIAQIECKNELYYFNNLQKKIELMEQYSFCFLDLIDSIQISSTETDSCIIDDFIESKIYTGYSDSVLFTSNTKFNCHTLNIQRSYNKMVFDVLDNGNITKVVHTLGNSRISEQFRTKPVERAFNANGFSEYWNSIVNRNNNIDIVTKSYSPSAYCVRRLGTVNYESMKSWFLTHILK